MKKNRKILRMFLTFCFTMAFLLNSVAYAAENDKGQTDFESVAAETQNKNSVYEENSKNKTFSSSFTAEELAEARKYVEENNLREKEKSKLTAKEALALIKANQDKHESIENSITITIDDVLESINPKDLATIAADTSGTYETDQMATGTPGVYWSVRVEYVLSQRTNGEYYFKSITKGTIYTHKKHLELLWCDYLLVETENRYHSILDNGTKIRIEADWNFTAYYSSGGIPTETSWSEYHYHDKNVSDVTP